MKGYRRMLMGVTGALLAASAGAGCDRFQPAQQAEPSPAAATPAANTAQYIVTPPKVSEDQIIARVNDRIITVQDFKQRTQELQLFGVDWKTLPEADRESLRGQLLEDLVRTELMARDTVARGAPRDAEVQASLWYMVRAFLARQWIQREQAALRVTQDEINTFYTERKEVYKVPGRLRVRQLAVRTDAEAKQLLRQILDGGNFAELAKAQSIAPNASSGGELGWVVRAFDQELYGRQGRQLEGVTLFPSAEGAVFALEQGSVSQVVKGPGVGGAPEAFYLFQVTEKQPPKDMALADVQDEIRALLTMDKLNKKVGDMKSSARVETYIDRVKAIKE